MPLSDSVDLVEYAWKEGQQGDILIKKAVACTMGDFAEAVIELFQSKSKIRKIGTRHAEKVYETLATSEELAKCEDNGDYLRVKMDSRDLNYDLYFNEGNPEIASLEEYNSHNAPALKVSEIVDLFRTLPEIQRDLKMAGLS